jgi:hypothetical protein
MRTARFGTKETGRNALQDSLWKNGDREFNRKRFKHSKTADRKKIDVTKLPSEFEPNKDYPDEEMCGVVNLGYLDTDGNVNEQYDGEVQIGGITHTVSKGRIRVLDSDVVQSEIQPILERHKYNQSVVSLMLLDPSDKIARFILGTNAYNKLPVEARPSTLANYNTRSEKYAEGLTLLEKVVRDSSIIIDSEAVYSYLNAGRLSSDAVMA